jgi:hypothetical protein
MDSNSSEVLVHIAAPCRPRDDAHYRSLASAYLSFEPSSVRMVASASISPGCFSNKPSQVHDARLLHTSQPESSLQSLNASFNSVLDNANSPTIRVANANIQSDSQSRALHSQDSWQAPPSVIQDSNPDPHVSWARYCSPTRALEYYSAAIPSPIASSQELPPLPGLPTGTPARQEPIVIHGTSSSAARIRGLHNVLPEPNSSSEVVQCSQSPLNTVARSPEPPNNCSSVLAPSSSRDARINITGVSARSPILQTAEQRNYSGKDVVGSSQDEISKQSSLVDETPSRVIPSCQIDRGSSTIPAFKRPHSSLTRADSEPLVVKRRRHDADFGVDAHTLARSASDLTISKIKVAIPASQTIRSSQDQSFLDHLDIFPPEPPVDELELEPKHLMTERLSQLATEMSIEKRFKPKEQTREILAFERGYWLLDCSTWEDTLTKETWGFLKNYVSSGNAGWGTWCRRDENWRWIRVYCWGFVVGHIYLLLYMASMRKVLYTGGSWFDGEGKEVLILGTKQR